MPCAYFDRCSSISCLGLERFDPKEAKIHGRGGQVQYQFDKHGSRAYVEYEEAPWRRSRQSDRDRAGRKTK